MHTEPRSCWAFRCVASREGGSGLVGNWVGTWVLLLSLPSDVLVSLMPHAVPL